MNSFNAAVLTAPGRIEIQRMRAETLNACEASLKILASGVCGTDLSIYRGDYPVPLPLVLGHEFVGLVDHASDGANADHLLGKRVVCEINNSCCAYGHSHQCAACEKGIPNHCLTRTVTGIIQHQGSFAERLVVPGRNLHELPDEISTDAAVLVEPLAAAIRTFELAPVTQEDVVVILGCGRLGRLVALVAHKAGARVIVVGRSRKHLELVSDYCWKGFTTAADAAGGHVEWVQGGGKLREAVLGLTKGLGADVVVEATGANANLLLAQQLARPLGVVSLKSTSGVNVDSFDTTKAIVDELRFQCSRCGPFDKAIDFMRVHGVPNQSWITAYFPLSRAAEAVEAAAHEPKVVIRCDTP